jgi:hypothetical protein
MWLMNGFNIINSGLVATMPTIWTIVGTGDYNGDGKTDILWRSAKGAQTIWFMNGFTVTSSQLVGI